MNRIGHLLAVLSCSLLLAGVGCDKPTSDPKSAPFGVPWGSDSATATRLMVEQGYRRLASNAAFERTLRFSGGAYLGITGMGNHIVRDTLPDGGALYHLLFSEGRLTSASMVAGYGDSSKVAPAAATLLKVHEYWWRGQPVRRWSDERGILWEWPVEDRVHASLEQNGPTSPEGGQQTFLVSVTYSRSDARGNDSAAAPGRLK